MSIYRGTFNVPKKISPDLDLNWGGRSLCNELSANWQACITKDFFG